MARKTCKSCIFRDNCSRQVVVKEPSQVISLGPIQISIGKKGKNYTMGLDGCTAHVSAPSNMPPKKPPAGVPVPVPGVKPPKGTKK